MQPIGSMLRKTTHHVTRQRELFALRTRKAGTSFATETRQASRELAGAVRAEAGAWGEYVKQSTAAVGGVIAPTNIERQLLERVAEMLRAVDARLRRRIESIETRAKRLRSPKGRLRSALNGKRASGAAHANGVTRRTASASRPRARAS